MGDGADRRVYGSARLAFVLTGVVALAGAFLWGLLVRRVEPVEWAVPAPLPRLLILKYGI